MEKIKIIFAGTAGIGTLLLKKIVKDERFDVSLVITQKDRPAGRKMELQPSPVKKNANDLSLEVFQPEYINTEESLNKICEKNADILLVVAYGQILKPELLALPKYGCINVHASLLPKYRGASPIQSAILNQEKNTGISVMKLEEKMDTGPIYQKFSIPIESDDNHITLTEKLAYLSERKVPDVLYEIVNDTKIPVVQNESDAVYCKKIIKLDGLIKWDEEIDLIDAKIRAFTGWPGTYTYFAGKSLKISESEMRVIKHNQPYSMVIKIGDMIGITAKNGIIIPVQLQIEGKKIQPLNEFINGNPDFINSKLTSEA